MTRFALPSLPGMMTQTESILKLKLKERACFWRYKSQFGELDLAWWPKLDTTWEEEEIGQIYFTIWTNTSINLDKYKNQSGQIQKSIWRLGSGVMTQTRHDVRRRGNWKVSRLKLELDDSAENKRHFSEEEKEKSETNLSGLFILFKLVCATLWR